MADKKFKNSCIRFRQAMEEEKEKRKKTIYLNKPCEKVKITSVVKLPNLCPSHIHSVAKPRSDVLYKLVKELGLDKEEDETRMKTKPDVLAKLVNDLELNKEVDEDFRRPLIQDVLYSIEPIAPGKRTRFKRCYGSITVVIYIRCSLDVWIIIENEKLIFPKPRNDTV